MTWGRAGAEMATLCSFRAGSAGGIRLADAAVEHEQPKMVPTYVLLTILFKGFIVGAQSKLITTNLL